MGHAIQPGSVEPYISNVSSADPLDYPLTLLLDSWRPKWNGRPTRSPTVQNSCRE